MLSDYSKSLGGHNTAANNLVAFLDTYKERQRAIDDEATRLRAELSALNKEETERWKAFNKEEENVQKRGTKVSVVVLANEPGEAELILTYVVTHAWWLSHYDVRAVIAGDENAKGKGESSVALHYRASISQKTGEDWAGVLLTLSTAAPLLGTDVPTLDPCWLSVRPSYTPGIETKGVLSRLRNGIHTTGSVSPTPAVYRRLSPSPPACIVVDSRRSRSRSRPRSRSSLVPSIVMDRPRAIPIHSVAPVVISTPEPPNFFRGVDSHAAEGAVSTTFTIPGLSTIPSDSDEEQQTHKVSIAELDFDSVDLEWVTVPRDTPSAFLRCKVKNTSSYVLLPGQANIFLNGGFVAKSTIPVRMRSL